MHKDIHFCLLCGDELQRRFSWRTLIESAHESVICAKCQAAFMVSGFAEGNVRALYQYNEAMKNYLNRYKFGGDVVLAKVFSQQIGEAVKSENATIVPIPMHPLKKKERTFAHIDELLIAARLPFEHVLEKTTTVTQVGKTREQRQNVAPLFRVSENAHISAKYYILIDDIYTTGTTIAHARQALLQAGAASVHAIVLIKG